MDDQHDKQLTQAGREALWDVAKIKALPNFDAAVFEEITGIKIEENSKKSELMSKADELITKANELKAQAEAM